MSIVTGVYGMAEPVEYPHESPLLARWVITTKMYHPTYRHFLLVLIHLRRHPEWDAPNITVPGATHAISSMTMDPDHLYRSGEDIKYLVPINFEAQFAAEDDAEAQRVLKECIDRVLAGGLTPESGLAPEGVTRDWREAISEIQRGV